MKTTDTATIEADTIEADTAHVYWQSNSDDVDMFVCTCGDYRVGVLRRFGAKRHLRAMRTNTVLAQHSLDDALDFEGDAKVSCVCGWRAYGIFRMWQARRHVNRAVKLDAWTQAREL